MLFISKEGQWYYEGVLIERMNLIRLFYSALRQMEDGTFAICTPAEVVPVQVEDMPYFVESVSHNEDRIIVHLNDSSDITLGKQNALRLTKEGRLILCIREGIEAAFSHNAYMSIASKMSLDSDGNYTLPGFEGAITEEK